MNGLTVLVENAPWYKKLEILRALKGWKQKEVAEKCGVDQRIYWNWENGIAILVKRNRKVIAKVFDIPESDIFSDIYKEQ